MKHLLIKTVEKYYSNEVDSQRLSQYQRLKDDPGWLFVEESLRYLQGLILNDIMSKEFTELGEKEKDIKQRTFKGVYDVIEFLINPPKVAETVLKIRQHNKGLAGKQPNGKRPIY